jgi:nitrous oxide reductase
MSRQHRSLHPNSARGCDTLLESWPDLTKTEKTNKQTKKPKPTHIHVTLDDGHSLVGFGLHHPKFVDLWKEHRNQLDSFEAVLRAGTIPVSVALYLTPVATTSIPSLNIHNAAAG